MLSKKVVKTLQDSGVIKFITDHKYYVEITKNDDLYKVEVRECRYDAFTLKKYGLLIGRPVIDWEADSMLEALILFNKASKKYVTKKSSRQGKGPCQLVSL